MRSPDAHHGGLDGCARDALGCERGAVDRRGRRVKLGDQPLPHPARRLNPVAAIAQHAVLQLRHQNADLAAARVQHSDQILLPGIHRAAPCEAEAAAAGLPVSFAATGPFDFAAAAGLFAVAAAFCVCGFVFSAPLDSVDAVSGAEAPAAVDAAALTASPAAAAVPGCISSTTCRS